MKGKWTAVVKNECETKEQSVYNIKKKLSSKASSSILAAAVLLNLLFRKSSGDKGDEAAGTHYLIKF